MRRINRPGFTVRTVFASCVATVDDDVLRQGLEECADTIEEAETDLEEKIVTNQIHTVEQKSTVYGNIGKAEMEIVYKYRMLRKGKPPRQFYDKLILSAPGQKCPLCLQRLVTTLDHYLPKAKYPIFAVTPINLIPACTDCNKIKLAQDPADESEITLHPYFDNVEDHSWLKCKVLETNPITFDFYVDVNFYPGLLGERLEYHFSSFELNKLYRTHAVEELQNKKFWLKKIFNRGGVDELREHLLECYDSSNDNFLNSWHTALYEGMLLNEWFCNGGVMNS